MDESPFELENESYSGLGRYEISKEGGWSLSNVVGIQVILKLVIGCDKG